MHARPVTDEERQQIIEALRAGESQTSVSKRFRRGAGTINRIAKEAGLEYSPPKNALLAKRLYDRAGRIRLLEAGLRKAEELLAGINKPSQIQPWSIAVGVLFDKLRLEEDTGGQGRAAILELMRRLREGGEDDAGAPEGEATAEHPAE